MVLCQMKGKLYFVHGYYSSQNQNVGIIENREIVRDRIILMRNDINNIYNVHIEDVSIFNQEYLPVMGDYVIYDGNRIEPANSNPTAQMYNMLGEALRYTIRNSDLYIAAYERRQTIEEVEDVRSFHVNVGHGNCSIIIFKEKGKYEAWIVDCSVKDMFNSFNYRNNLIKCLNDLKNKYNITKISKLLITHPHYDHINGIHHLLNCGIVDSETEVWFNTNLPWNSKTYINLVSRLRGIRVQFVDPIISNSTQNLRIIYPNKSYHSLNNVPAKNVNNASVIYQICFNDISMMFTGDIETEGWDIVNCLPGLNKTTYYCISHHGSINGHIRNKCNYIYPQSIHTMANCGQSTAKQILMGRDGAYLGIFSNNVLSDFARTIERTDQVTSYIELNWMNGKVSKA